MADPVNDRQDPAGTRAWYREPWPWVLIAIPALTIIASAVTLWLALSRPDYLVLDAPEYQQVRSQLRAEPPAEVKPAGQVADEPDGNR